jgi:hypothetical protein
VGRFTQSRRIQLAIIGIIKARRTEFSPHARATPIGIIKEVPTIARRIDDIFNRLNINMNFPAFFNLNL